MIRLLPILLVGAACGPQVTHRYTKEAPSPLAPRTPHQVELLTVPPNDRRFVEIGYIEVTDGSRYTGTGRAALLRLARHRAATMGCEAIVARRADTVESGLFDNSAGTVKGYVAACLVFPDG